MFYKFLYSWSCLFFKHVTIYSINSEIAFYGILKM